MSSVDVHTQCGYQTMLDEAVAIVVAPTDARRRVGIFRLTTPGGLKLVQASRGTFARGGGGEGACDVFSLTIPGKQLCGYSTADHVQSFPDDMELLL
eukprot:365066-Chlamydomonas_euryale.AAC.2